TVSETFPLEIRALAIAFFYAVGTGIGGIIGPWLFGILIDTGSRASLFIGYLIGSVLMLLAGRGPLGGGHRVRTQVPGNGGASARLRRLKRAAASFCALRRRGSGASRCAANAWRRIASPATKPKAGALTCGLRV